MVDFVLILSFGLLFLLCYPIYQDLIRALQGKETTFNGKQYMPLKLFVLLLSGGVVLGLIIGLFSL